VKEEEIATVSDIVESSEKKYASDIAQASENEICKRQSQKPAKAKFAGDTIKSGEKRYTRRHRGIRRIA
jgi:dihydroxyacetone kinase